MLSTTLVEEPIMDTVIRDTRHGERERSLSRTRRLVDKIFDGGDAAIASASGAALLGASVAGLGGSLIAASVAGGAVVYLTAISRSSRNGTH